MGRPRETVYAAMLATAIGIDRSIEAEIRRAVARDDRLWPLDSHRRSSGNDPVEVCDAVKPIAVGHALLQIEARWSRVACRATPVNRLDRHGRSMPAG